MNKKTKSIICIVVCVALLVVLITIGISSCTGGKENIPIDATQDATTAGTVFETEEPVVTVPGVMVSPFDEAATAGTEESVPPTDQEDETNPTEEDEETEPTEETTEPADNAGLTEYEYYLKMSSDEQVAFFNSFDSVEDFIRWYNEAKAEYEALHPGIDAGSGSFDFGEITS